MQATVHHFDPATDSGSVLLDDGREVPFDGDVFAHSVLRHLQTGQRVSIVLGEGALTRLWIRGIGEGETIH